MATTDSELALKRQQFFRVLLGEAEKQSRAKRVENLHDGAPPKFNYVTAHRGSFVFAYVVIAHKSRIELDIDRRGPGGQEWNKRAFDRLYAQKKAIQAAFGAELDWRRQDDKSVSRILVEFDQGLEHRDAWPKLHAAMVDAMIRLECATRRQIEEIAVP